MRLYCFSLSHFPLSKCLTAGLTQYWQRVLLALQDQACFCLCIVHLPGEPCSLHYYIVAGCLAPKLVLI